MLALVVHKCVTQVVLLALVALTMCYASGVTGSGSVTSVSRKGCPHRTWLLLPRRAEGRGSLKCPKACTPRKTRSTPWDPSRGWFQWKPSARQISTRVAKNRPQPVAGPVGDGELYKCHTVRSELHKCHTVGRKRTLKVTQISHRGRRRTHRVTQMSYSRPQTDAQSYTIVT
jgi:hypothetical protein